MFSCSKEPSQKTGPDRFSSFGPTKLVRTDDSVTISWDPITHSSPGTNVVYKVNLSNGVSINTGGVTRIAIGNLSHLSTYAGKIVAYINAADSALTEFTVSDFLGIMIIGRTDQAQGRNVVEAYDVFNGSRLWQTKVSDYYNSVFPEAVISNDTVFIGANNGNAPLLRAMHLGTGRIFYAAINNNGYSLGHLTYSNGKLFFNLGTQLVCINSTSGFIAWTNYGEPGLGITGKPLVVGNTVYAGSTTQVPNIPFKLFAMDAATGTVRWSFIFEGEFYAAPMYDEGKIYFNTSTGLYAVNASTGTLLWKKMNEGSFKNSNNMIIRNNKIIMTGPRNYGTYCLNKNDGSMLWQYAPNSYLQSSISEANGKVFFTEIGSSITNNVVTAISLETGGLLWSKPTQFMFSFIVGDRLYSRSNFRSDVEVRKAVDGELVFTMANPGNYYTDNRAWFSISLNKTFYDTRVLN